MYVVVGQRHCIAPSFPEQFLSTETHSWRRWEDLEMDKTMNSNFRALEGH